MSSSYMDDDGYDRAAAEAMEELERRGAPRIAPAAGPQPQPPIQEGGCVECGKEASQKRFHDAFSLHVCYDCQRLHKACSPPQPLLPSGSAEGLACGQGVGGKYQLLSKTTVREEFLLTERQLSAAQGGLSRNMREHGE